MSDKDSSEQINHEIEEREFAFEQEDGNSPDVPEIHREIMKEQLEPHEGNEQVPVWTFMVFMALAVWAGWYINEYDGNFLANVYDGPNAFSAVVDADGVKKKEPIDPEKLGKRVFNTCITCHQANGEGVVGKYPPLNKSEWVAGDDRVLARILLNGLSGEIEVLGQKYNNQMPPWKQFSDYEIAAVLTHIRKSWDNDLPAVAPSTITEVRAEIADQPLPYNPADLLKLELAARDPIDEAAIFQEYKDAGDIELMPEIDEDKWTMNLNKDYMIKRLTEVTGGDVERGSGLFLTATCITCHVGNDTSKAIAPSLNGIATRMKREEIIDSILHPSNKIAEGFGAIKVVDAFEGKIYSGSVVEDTEDVLRLRLASGEEVEIHPDDVEERMPDPTSPMPEGLIDRLSVEQVADLFAYLESLPPDPGSEASPSETTDDANEESTKEAESSDEKS